MKKYRYLASAPLVAAGLLGVVYMPACGDNPITPPGGIVPPGCDLKCGGSIAEGSASISGIASVDSFFGSVINFNAKANLISSGIESELGKLRAQVGAAADADADALVAAIKAKYHVEGDLAVNYTPAKCTVSAKATIEAQAKCDVDVKPGSAKLTCSGTCEVDASAKAECSADAKISCRGTAPNLACSGTCKGTCQVDLSTAGTCEGTCNGTCTGGTSTGGKCTGQCQGTCDVQLNAAGSCTGKCKGECEYTPPSGSCEAGATVQCKTEASATAECNGRCDGQVTPPSAKAECQASAKANASINADCTPPSLDIKYKLAAGASVEAFEAFLVSFRASYGAILASLKQSQMLISASAQIGTDATALVDVVGKIAVTGNLRAKVGVLCAGNELPKVASSIGAATSRLKGNVDVVGKLSAKLGKPL